jgi:molecular chaperone DnaK
MMKDAESHSEEDKKRKQEIEVRNRADQAVYAAEKMLHEMGDKLVASDKSAVESAVEGLKNAINSNDTAGIERAMDLLTQTQHKAAEALYKNTGANAGSPGSQGAPGSEGAGSSGSTGSTGSGASQGDVIDAEVVDDK